MTEGGMEGDKTRVHDGRCVAFAVYCLHMNTIAWYR